MSLAERRAVGAWLLVLWFLVLLMVMVGGTTRLTGSGLSIVDWRPVTGALPPLDEQAWQEAFSAYQGSPQFKRENHWMSLADFKRIYFWEYVHRLFGRLIGLAFVLPFAYFVWRRILRGALIGRTLLLLVLGGLQGALGWYMVKSGLVNEPRVSHYRLAAHLLLGVGVGQCILWQALEVANPRDRGAALPALSRYFTCGAFGLLALQLLYGAFVAGTRAGHVAATFPDMNGRYAPSAFFVTGSLTRDLFENPLSIHYVHRALALVVLLHACAVVAVVWKRGQAVRVSALLYLAAILGQVSLGALTVILHVPTPVAVAHQGGAYVACSAAVFLAHAALGASATRQPPAASGLPGADLEQHGLAHHPHTLRGRG